MLYEVRVRCPSCDYINKVKVEEHEDEEAFPIIGETCIRCNTELDKYVLSELEVLNN